MNGYNILDAIRWLEYARQDLDSSEKMLTQGDFVYRHICFLSQQAAEKAIKAVFIYLQIDFPWRHDLDALRNLLPDDWQVKHEHTDLAQLTEWAVESRYPGDWNDANLEEARASYQQAMEIVESIIAEFSRRGVSINLD